MAIFDFATDLIVKQSLNLPSDDVSTAGGGINIASGATVNTSTVGKWMPTLFCQETGTVDVDTEVQYQLVYLSSTADDMVITSPKVTFVNSIRSMSSDTVNVVSSSASDTSTKLVRLWGNSSGSLAYEDLVLNGTSTVTGSTTFSEVYRAEIRENNADLAQTTCAGTLTLTENSGGTTIATIQAGQRTASREYALAAAGSVGNQATFTNRRTEPSGSPSWSIPNLGEGTSVTLAGPLDTVGGGDDWTGIYCRQTVQPGMPTALIDLKLAFDGDVTYGAP